MIEKYRTFLRHMGKSKRTITQYCQVVTRWLDSEQSPAEFTAAGQPSASTHNQRAAAIRLYYKSLGEDVPEIPTWRVNQAPPRYLSVEDVAQWLIEIRRSGWREYAAACLMYSAGLRVSEITSLRLEDLNLEQRFVRVTGKGGIIRQVPFDAEVTGPALEFYLTWIRPKLEQRISPAVVLLGDRGGMYDSRVITKAVRAGAQRADLADLNRPCHQLRHSFATHMVEGGVDLRNLQMMLGHKDLKTTQCYIAVDPNKARSVYDAAHPLAQRKPEIDRTLEVLEA